ncbi:hypothetical protein CIW48_29640 [Methylobacterium sp. P1-11]|nr:hypothetical protein CIW48_29640 [Methylobacterium sp. P1-11]
MAGDRHTSDGSVRPLPESLNRLLLIDPTHQIEWVGDPVAEYLRPTVVDRVLWWFSVAAFGAAAFITSATMTIRLLQ